jgi:DNA-directed RNA polymerase subunit RPC12/RpoP
MIDSVVNLLFRCSHRRLTRPVTPVSKAGVPHGQTYVVCLDCGKQFSYDLTEMRVGKRLESSHDGGVLHPDMPRPSRKLKYALWASVPLAFLAGAFLRNGKKPRTTKEKP